MCNTSGTSFDLKCCIAIVRSYVIVRARCAIRETQTSFMSQQLQISSLFSAFALVCLCLFARAGGDGELRLAASGISDIASPIVQVIAQAD